jgi:ribosome-associated translation inhibitor RaiA
MKIEVRFRGIQASDALRAYVVRRIHFQLSRFNTEVGSVVVRIGDINGPKGGADKRCHVAVRGPALGPVTIEELRTDAYVAVDLAVQRAACAVGREIERARASRRGEDAMRRAS